MMTERESLYLYDNIVLKSRKTNVYVHDGVRIAILSIHCSGTTY